MKKISFEQRLINEHMELLLVPHKGSKCGWKRGKQWCLSDVDYPSRLDLGI